MRRIGRTLVIFCLCTWACGSGDENSHDQGAVEVDTKSSDQGTIDEGTPEPDFSPQDPGPITTDEGPVLVDTNLPPQTSRTFHMGLTPWPYDFTLDAVLDTYNKINAHGDLLAHHFDNGIPWEEALTGQPYHPQVEEQLAFRLAQTGPDKKVYLAISSLNITRNGLAPYWAENDNSPLPGAWATRNFADPEVAQAYINYALDLIGRFKPTWFNYGVEANELILNVPEAFDDYVTFAGTVYQAIHAAHPEVEILVSCTLKAPDSDEAMTVVDAMPALLQHVDMIGISVYPYVFYGHPNAGNPTNMHPDWLAQAQLIAGGKPLAVTETGWPAQDLVIPSFSVNTASNPEFQKTYVEMLFTEAEALNLDFVVWFTVVDFDALWEGLPSESEAALYIKDLAKIWRDTGFYGEDLNPRPALSVWESWHQAPKL